MGSSVLTPPPLAPTGPLAAAPAAATLTGRPELPAVEGTAEAARLGAAEAARLGAADVAPPGTCISSTFAARRAAKPAAATCTARAASKRARRRFMPEERRQSGAKAGTGAGGSAGAAASIAASRGIREAGVIAVWTFAVLHCANVCCAQDTPRQWPRRAHLGRGVGGQRAQRLNQSLVQPSPDARRVSRRVHAACRSRPEGAGRGRRAVAAPRMPACSKTRTGRPASNGACTRRAVRRQKTRRGGVTQGRAKPSCAAARPPPAPQTWASRGQRVGRLTAAHTRPSCRLCAPARAPPRVPFTALTKTAAMLQAHMQHGLVRQVLPQPHARRGACGCVQRGAHHGPLLQASSAQAGRVPRQKARNPRQALRQRPSAQKSL